MKQNTPILPKKTWRQFMHAIFLMLKKGIISKTKIFTDLNIIIKRGKIAGKSLHNLLFHHHHHHHPHHLPFTTQLPSNNDDDEFSCTTTPLQQTHAPPSANHIDEIIAFPLQEFGKSPTVKQLRITDSPFPLNYRDDDGYVDEAAEKFILRFYNGLKRED